VGLGAFIGIGRSLETALQRVELAERLGYESAYVTHIAGRDSVTVLMAYAARSQRLMLGTGVTPIYSRTPVATAQSFATLDEFSGGRAIIGLGVSHRPVVEGWYGQSIDKPLEEMREYVGVVRAILRGEDPPSGNKFGSGFHFIGFEPRPDVPIYLAGLAPGMLRLAGEIADGVVLWLCNPEYIRNTVVPMVAEGRAKAGKPAEGFDIVAAVPGAVTSEPEQATAQLRSELIPYFLLPFYRKMIELSGYADDLAGFDERGPEAISDDFITNLAAIGTAAQAAATVRSYAESGATSPCVGGISKTDVDTTLEALAGSLG
jgi:alkanesulfonate monooxygenase SsuD/methylene tetrahydromethanopterin reductase-like flavin-dependent oxidoreductase (luciferase family)